MAVTRAGSRTGGGLAFRLPPVLQLGVRMPQLLFLVILIALWHYLTTSGAVNPLILPRIDLTVTKFVTLWQRPETYIHIQTTLVEWAVAFALSMIVGIGLGFVIGWYKYVTEVFEPLILALYAIPIIIIYPLCILFFGLGSASKIAFAAVYGFFPIIINTINGIRTADRRLIDVSISMGASTPQMLFKVLIPAALPAIMTGVRLGLLGEFLAVIAGETIAGPFGIGSQIKKDMETFNTPELYAYIFIALILATILNVIASRLEKSVRRD